MNNINVGIVGDGLTDYKVFGKIVECILLEEISENVKFDIIPLIRKNIFDHVQKYKNACRKNPEGYYLPNKIAVELRDSICGTIIQAFEEFKDNVDISYSDILLITTDTEHILKDKNQYFDTWAISLSHILREAIEISRLYCMWYLHHR